MQPRPTDERHAILADRVFDGRAWRGRAALFVRCGRIEGFGTWEEVPADCAQTRLPDGGILAPGLIDLQVNGGGGILLNDRPDAKAMLGIAQAHRRFGTTGCLPTLITDAPKRRHEAIAAARSIVGRDGVLGLHLEGPFISRQRPGVHPPEHIMEANAEDLDTLCGLAEVGRSLVTLAPETVPAGFIRRLTSAGVRVAIGHSEASADVTLRAIDEGATGVTHLFNAMPPLYARAPGIAGVALADRRVTAGLIVDGLHVDPIAVRAAFLAKGADRIALVTDAMPTVGGSIDRFELMGRTVTLANGRLTTQNDTLAGAHLDMASAVRNAVNLVQIPLEEALRAASLTPASFLGLENERGALIAGARADLVALNGELQVIATWIEGMGVSEPSPRPLAETC